MLEEKGGSHHAARVVSRVVGPLLVLVASPVDFSSWSSISRNNDMAKSLGAFDVRKVPESQNHAKQENMLHSVKIKLKGIVYKTPRINGKQVQVLIKLS
jgi:hypothetical protein